MLRSFKLKKFLKKEDLLIDDISQTVNSAIDEKKDSLLIRILTKIHHADLADYISSATQEQKEYVLLILGNKLNPETLLELDLDVLRSVKKIVGIKNFALLISKLKNDKASDLLIDLTKHERNEILSKIPAFKRSALKKLLTYPKDSAGMMMSTSYVSVTNNMNVGQVLDYLTENNELPEDFDEIYVLNKNGQPLGNIHVSKLLRSKKTMSVELAMNQDIKKIDAHIDQEEVSYMFRHYDLTTAPVVSKSGKMLGLINTSKVIDVTLEEAEEDILKLGGVGITDLYSALYKTVIRRFPWLFVNLITAFLTSLVIVAFENSIQKLVALASILPIVASMGGNVGTQSVTVSVRAIANRDINSENIRRVVGKEIAACTINGLVLGLLGGVIIYLVHGSADIAGVFSLAVIINFSLAGLWGSVIPILLHRAGADPAISSGVFLTFFTDLLGFFVFLALAWWIIL